MHNLFSIKRKGAAVPLPPPGDLPELPEPHELEDLPPLEIPDGFISKKKQPLENFRSKVFSKEMREVEEHVPTEPIFVKLYSFKEVMDEFGQIKTKIDESENMLGQMDKLFLNQGQEYKKWQDTMKNVHEKLIFVDEMLFRGR